jgi:hypothetical protein
LPLVWWSIIHLLLYSGHHDHRSAICFETSLQCKCDNSVTCYVVLLLLFQLLYSMTLPQYGSLKLKLVLCK